MTTRQLSLPFALDVDGSLREHVDPDKQVGDRLRSLVETEPGQRVMLPTYGMALSGMVFEPDDEIVQNEVDRELRDQASMWEPEVEIQAVSLPVASDEEGGVGLQIQWERTGSARSWGAATGTKRAVIGTSGVISEGVAT